MTYPGIRRSELASGVRVITERMPEARSVSVGMWFRVGSRDEPVRARRCVALPRAPALQGHRGAFGPRHRHGGRRRGRRDERLHQPRAHRVLPAPAGGRARSGPASAGRRGERAGLPTPRARRRAGGHRRGDPHERGHPRRPGAHRALREPLPRAPARQGDPRHPRHGRGHDPDRRRRVPRAAGTGRPTWSIAAAGDLAHDEVLAAVDGCSTAAPGGEAAGPRARPAPMSSRSSSSTDRPSRPTSPWAGGRCRSTTTTATPCGSPTTSSAAACRAGCSRRSARSGAWPTRCSRRLRPTATSARW